MSDLIDRPRILIVDDEEPIRQAFKAILSDRAEVETASNGTEALERFNQSVFNVVVTDVQMSGSNGMEVLQEIKRINPYVEVIIVTAYPSVEMAVEAIKIGAFDFIRKPFPPAELAGIVDRCLEKQKNASHVNLDELMTLLQASETIVAVNDMDALLDRIIDSAVVLTQAKRGSLMIVEDDSQELVIKAARGIDPEVVRNTRVKLGEGISGKVAMEGTLLLVADIEKDQRTRIEKKPQYETKSFLCVPIVTIHPTARKVTYGVINVSDKISGGQFSERDRVLLYILAGQAAVAIEDFSLYAQLNLKIADLEDTVKKLTETQNQLIQSEKMVSMGHMASGIAHELRNPLAVILMGTEFLGTCGNVDKEVLEEIKVSVHRANNIITDLLRFSRASRLDAKPINICEMLDEVVVLLRSHSGVEKIKINREFPGLPIVISGDPNLLRQVFFNLGGNAIDAMPSGGELTFTVDVVAIAVDGPRLAVIKVADTGMGIPEDKLAKIFEPFFTTKEEGKGTGLGLSIVSLILDRHKGKIEVASQLGKGTVFTIKLPLA